MWNPESENARDMAFKAFKTNGSYDNFIAYKIACNKFRIFIKNHKRKSWRKFCSNITPETPTREVWNKANMMKRAKRPTCSKDTSWCQDYLLMLSREAPPVPPPENSIPFVLEFNAFKEVLKDMSNIVETKKKKFCSRKIAADDVTDGV